MSDNMIEMLGEPFSISTRIGIQLDDQMIWEIREALKEKMQGTVFGEVFGRCRAPVERVYLPMHSGIMQYCEQKIKEKA